LQNYINNPFNDANKTSILVPNIGFDDPVYYTSTPPYFKGALLMIFL